MFSLLLLAMTACGTYGLSTPQDTAPPDDASPPRGAQGSGDFSDDSSGDFSGPGGSSDSTPDDSTDDDSTPDPDPDPTDPDTDDAISASLQGLTWSLDLADVTFIEPVGMGSVIGMLDSTQLLLHIDRERSDSLEMLLTLADANGGQDPCERIIALPDADWSANPEFAIDEDELEMVVGGAPLILRDALFSGIIAGQGESWGGGVIYGLADTRELPESISQDLGVDICDLLAVMGSACEPCDDGANACFLLHMDDVSGKEFAGPFDPDGGC